MNKKGLILDDLGFTGFVDVLRRDYIQPLCNVLYGDEAFHLDSHR